MMFALITKILEVAKVKEDEIEAMCGITLVISLLENVSGIESSLPSFIDFFIKELISSKTPEYKSMLM
jgi:hypothetical protein